MKNLIIIAVFLLSPLPFFAQQLSGLWIGTLTNDSTSIRQDQSFEIILSEYKSKVTGYSRSTFIVNDTLYYIVKRVKGVIENGVCEVKDDEIVSSNFPKRIEKGVKMVHTFRMNRQDSTWQLDGEWKTTQTKKYYSVSGKSDLEEEKDIDNSKIFPHLEELSMGQDIPYFVEAKKAKEESIARQIEADRKKTTSFLPEQQKSVSNTMAVNKPTSIVKANTVPVDNKIAVPEEKPSITQVQPEQQTVVKQTTSEKPSTRVKTNTVPVKETVFTTAETGPGTTQGTATNNESGKNPASSGAIAKQDEKQQPANTGVVIAAVTNEKPVSAAATTGQQDKTTADNTATKTAANNKPETASGKNEIVSTTKNITAATTSSKSNVSPVATHTNGSATAVADETGSKTGAAAGNDQTITKPVNTTPATNSITQTGSAGQSLVKKNEDEAPALQPLVSLALPVADAGAAAKKASERRTDAQQTVLFKADSLVIAVYDNGEVDGDTVSVLLNGQVVMARQGLKTTAVKQTIYLPAGSDEEFTLVLYAENLGKYPPNTGLLVIYDGEERHYVRFSADLQRNAAVTLKRKNKNE